MIPEQLKDCRFCKILTKSKKPYEKAWQMLETDYTQQRNGTWKHNETGELYTVTENIDGKKERIPYKGLIHNYSYENICIHVEAGDNYGTLAGVNSLGILDDDTLDKKLIKLYDEHFNPTFGVREHKYIHLKNWDGKKIIFFDEDGTHMGELQGIGTQAVGPGSIHPSGEIYELKEDLPIIEIDYADFIKVFGDYVQKKVTVVREHKPTSWEGDDIKDIPIGNIISFVGLKDVGGGCYQGEHPKHGSTGGMNFRVDTHNNTWYCFRCQTGGSSPELIGVMEGVIDCSSAGSSCYTSEQGKEVIQIAREKYGLKAPELQQSLEPRGWACSINIKKMAERYNFTKCHLCNKDLTFNEVVGWYKCDNCGVKGGLKQFAELIKKRKETTE